ncbi:flavoprotein [Endomicrobium proavitum]|uniref:4-phosphopantothenoylcysteine decarboxylase n=1 Tax=Endomicrobium proavitum TaxID=1408281 RepID=A0A0G3WJA4_9BACT|nr:flavoprotein [Endomicrobium proavitum]AKL97554.1 4-phosphopantothenoylcysteine decarboxylase [Endomicrobium proavitum]
MSLKGKNIIVGITGSIAAYKACDAVRALVKLGANVECILTKNGAEFITALTLQTLSKNKVHACMFETPKEWEIDHISLAKKADVIAVVPATADIIARLAVGRADDLLSCAILASKAKIIICPAMNSNMLRHKATKKNIETLKSYGYKFVNSQEGELACGDKGDGRLAPVDEIIKVILKEA